MPAEPRITAKVMFTMPLRNIISQCGLANSVRTSSTSRVFCSAGGWMRSRVVAKQIRNSTTAAMLKAATVSWAPRAGLPAPKVTMSERKLVLAMIPPTWASDIR